MMDDNAIVGFEDLLQKCGLKKTKPRLKVLEILSTREMATSQPDLERLIGKEIDRVTLYRTLNTFEEKGLIHKIIDLHGTANYAIGELSNDEHHLHEHVHFNCTACLNVYCLEKLEIPQLEMPKGFHSSNIHLLVYGICEICNAKANQYAEQINYK
jgi:Fur family ferric uptake transcriptional regulator